MQKEQLEMLNVVQEVMRGVVTSVIAAAPAHASALSSSLAAFSTHPGITQEAKAMLEDLATGAGMLASAQQPRQ